MMSSGTDPEPRNIISQRNISNFKRAIGFDENKGDTVPNYLHKIAKVGK